MTHDDTLRRAAEFLRNPEARDQASAEWFDQNGTAAALDALRDVKLELDDGQLLKKKIDTLRHSANEWADMATTGLQWVRNIVDGISDPRYALQNLKECLAHCQQVDNSSPQPAQAPDGWRVVYDGDSMPMVTDDIGRLFRVQQNLCGKWTHPHSPQELADRLAAAPQPKDPKL